MSFLNSILKIFLCLCLGFYLPSADAATIFQGLDISDSEFSAFVESDPANRSFVKSFLESKIDLKKVESLLNKFEVAKLGFLEGKKKLSCSEFERLSRLQNTEGWPLGAREIIYHSLILLSLCESAESNQQELLRRAQEFAPELTPPKNLLSKRHIEIYNLVKKRQRYVELDFERWQKSWPVIIVNGRKIASSQNRKMDLPNVVTKVTFLSNKFEPVSWSGFVSSLKYFEPVERPFLAQCDDDFSQSKGEFFKSGDVAYFSLDCQRQWVGGKWQQENSIAVNNSEMTSSLPWKDAEKPSTLKTYGTILAVVAGAIALGIYSSQSQKRRR